MNEKEIVNEWLTKDIQMSINNVDDVQLFTVILSQMLVDCAKDKQFMDWLTSDNPSEALRAGLAIARPVLCAYMYSKDKAIGITQKDDKNVDSGQIIK